MSPTTPHIASQLRHLIYYHLDQDLISNALFLAGRLQGYEPRSPEAAHLLSLCHLRLGQTQAAYDASRSQGSRGLHLGCAYVFAQACRDLPHRHKEGIGALERSRGLWGGRNNWNKHSETTRRHLPDAAAAYCLLGKLWLGHGDPLKAVECFEESLKLNPFMWDAFTGLTDTGANIRIPNIFKMTPEMLAILSSESEGAPDVDLSTEEVSRGGPLQSQKNNNSTNAPPQIDPFLAPSLSSTVGQHSTLNGASRFQKLSDSLASHLSSKGSPLNIGGGSCVEAMETPTGPGGAMDTKVMGALVGGGSGTALSTATEPPHAPVRKQRPLHHMDFGNDAPPRMRATSTKARMASRSEVEEISDAAPATRHGASLSVNGAHKRTISGHSTHASTSQANDPSAPGQRRSVRLFNQIRPTSSKFSSTTGSLGHREGRDLKKARATGTKGRVGNGSSTVGRVVSGNRKPIEMDIDSKENLQSQTHVITQPSNTNSGASKVTKQHEALQCLLDLFGRLGDGHYSLAHFLCQEAIQSLSAIPSSQKQTPWVLAQMGRAYYEQASYTEAEKYFRKIRSTTPSRLEDMEIYSTVLWHLKNDVELAYLAHELLDIDRLSPQAWCALGNTFSLQRDHDQALKCFKRAAQLDPKFAYAYTHQGHEYISNEEYDKALAAYRSGVAAENRYYNAWYGLGKVNEKLGDYDAAIKHFQTAAAINPKNSVLIVCIGVALEKLKNPRAALIYYAQAEKIAPRSTLARFNKARVHMSLQEPILALEELQLSKDLAPDDANVHFWLGKVYKTLRQKANAIKYFTIALNLDPKANQTIKNAIESLEDEADDDDMS
ncbi:MAG: anaphase-promoting complex subunit cdc27 [Caeruleum heppii]|nr:MAG: anaphase-promoting complex subunit cdc27 [Caeruleum heppii]